MTVSVVRVDVPEAPAIPGMSFRRMRLPDDLEAIAALFNAANVEDGVEDRNDAEGLAQWFAHASTWNPLEDIVLAEVDGQLVGYGKVHWVDDTDGGRNYACWGCVHPEWRRRGLGRALHRANVRRLREIAAGQQVPDGMPRRLDSWAMETQAGARALLESEGFTVARYFFEMLRPTLDDITEFPLPEGLEVRPVRPEDHRAIWAADLEAFADHWGGKDTLGGDVPALLQRPRLRAGAVARRLGRRRGGGPVQQHGHARAQRADRHPPRPPGGRVRSAPVARAGAGSRAGLPEPGRRSATGA